MTTPIDTLPRFLTLGGAHVILKEDGTQKANNVFWECLGCDAANSFGNTWTAARCEANAHASECRSIPKNATGS